MPNVSRPDLLPFALPARIGLDKHGLVKDGELTLPNSVVIDYEQPLYGDCHVIEHPRAKITVVSAEQQAADTAAGNQWLLYALLSGRDRCIGGQQIGPPTDYTDYHLYCDADHAWIIRTVVTPGAGSTQCDVYLENLFGVFSDTTLSMTSRLLAHYQWTPQRTDGGSLIGSPICGNRFLISPSKTGGSVLINVGSTDVTGSNWVGTAIGDSRDDVRGMYQHDLLTVTIAGTGLTTPGSIGAGITASIHHSKTAADLRISYEYVSETGLETYASYTTTDSEYQCCWIYTPSGGQTNQTSTFSYIAWVEYSIEGNPAAIYSALNESWSFAGATVVSSLEFSGFTYSGGASSDGTLITNGVSTAIVTPSGIYSIQAYSRFTVYLCTDNLIGCTAPNLPWTIVGSGGESTSHTANTSLSGRYYTYNPKTGDIAVGVNQEVCYV